MATGTMPEKYDPKFTQHVIDTMGPKTAPRTRQIFTSLIRHLHDFARELELSTEEWLEGVKFINSIGQISNRTRNEAHRMSDIFGLESLVVEINNYHALKADQRPTSHAILGPFWSPDAPFRKNGDSIIMSPHKGQVALMHGQVTDVVTQMPIANAVVDIWEASSNGKYDFQDPDNQVDNNLRGKFRTDGNGYYHLYCLKPTAYSLPTDGPAGQIFQILDRHPMRPAHIHVMVTHEKFHPLVNQIYPDDDQYLETDTVFAVKDDLVVHFDSSKGDNKAELDLEFNIALVPKRDEESTAAARL